MTWQWFRVQGLRSHDCPVLESVSLAAENVRLARSRRGIDCVPVSGAKIRCSMLTHDPHRGFPKLGVFKIIVSWGSFPGSPHFKEPTNY